MSRLGTGRLLDAGCGLGFETARLAGEGRELVGVDWDVAAASAAARAHRGAGLLASCSDAGRLGFRDGTFDYVCSSHIVEHFDTPARHVSEVARVLDAGGTAFFLTPNAPWDFENPFHVVLFRRDELASLLREHFEEVLVTGLDASARVKRDFAERRGKATRLLSRVDPWDVRHRVPRSWLVAFYSRALPLVYRLVSSDDSGGGTGITEEDYFVSDEIDDSTPVLFAIASRPIRPRSRGCAPPSVAPGAPGAR